MGKVIDFPKEKMKTPPQSKKEFCLLYTSDAADE